MLAAWAISLVLVVLTIVIHYEALRSLARHIDELKLPFRVRLRLVLIMLALFGTHIVEVMLFAGGLYVAADVLGLGTLNGKVTGTFRDFIYFSMVSYTTLGFGDIVPLRGLRVITGIESLAGLLMITWSASFTFVYMERFWKLGRTWFGRPTE